MWLKLELRKFSTRNIFSWLPLMIVCSSARNFAVLSLASSFRYYDAQCHVKGGTTGRAIKATLG